MNHLKTLASAAVMALALLAITAASASATILTDGSGTQLKTGTSITAESEGKTILDPPFGTIECSKSHIGGKTSNDGGGATTNVNITVETLSWSECNASMTVLAKGTLSVEGTSGNNGTLFSTGTEVTTSYLGFHCIFKTNNTKLGTVTGSANTKGNATLDIEATIPRTGGTSGSFCGSTAAWTGAYKFTSPSTMNIDKEVNEHFTTLTDASKNQLKTGTSITAESEGATTLHPAFGSVSCEESHFGGKTTSDGGESALSVTAVVEALTWSKCNATVTVLAKGTMRITSAGNNNAFLYSTGTEVTIVSGGGLHCIFKTNETTLGTITGSATTGGNATLDISATIPRTGGSSGVSCGSTAAWTGAYKFTTPTALNIDGTPVDPPPSTVLTDGSGNQLKTGTTITAESEGKTTLHLPSTDLECENSHFGGKTTSDGGGGNNVSASVSDFTLSKCNVTVTVLAKGTLSIKATGSSNGELLSTGTELTVVSGGLHCIFKTNNTKLGTITGSANTKSNATLDLEATLPRTGGSSGVSCGSTAQWTGAYKFTAPSTLNID
jgi:hypothetical protein